MNDLNQTRTRRRRQRGQAMVEYSMINWILVVGAHRRSIREDGLGGAPEENVIDMFLEAYQIYYDSITSC